MSQEQRPSPRIAQYITEDWLAVVVGLVLVGLVLAGVLRNIP